MKRVLSITAAIGLVAMAAPLPAASAPKPTVILEDVLGDSNFINDQGTGDGSFGDFNQAPVGNVSDLVKVSLSSDAKNLYVLFEANGVPPATQGLGFRLRVNPVGPAGTQCLFFEAFWPGATNAMTEAKAHVRDSCAGTPPVPVKIQGAFLTVPRKGIDALKKGAVLEMPQAQSFVYSGAEYPAGVIGPYMDTTKVGKDYKLAN